MPNLSTSPRLRGTSGALEVTVTLERPYPDGRLVGCATVRLREGETLSEAADRAVTHARMQKLDEQ